MTRTISITRFAACALAFALSTACKTEKAPPQDSTRATANVAPGQGTATGADSAARKLGVLAQMKTPESVHYDADLDAWFVSNINGNPSQHDGNGYIVRVPAESTTTVTMFAEGGKNGVRLDAPKGIATTADQLWVADIDAIRVFDKRTQEAGCLHCHQVVEIIRQDPIDKGTFDKLKDNGDPGPEPVAEIMKVVARVKKERREVHRRS